MEVSKSVVKKIAHDMKNGRKASKKLKEYVKECISVSQALNRK